MWSHSLARGCGIQLHAIIDGRTGGTVAPQTKIWEEEPPPPHTHTHTHTHTHFGAEKHLQMNLTLMNFTCVIDNFRAFLP